MEGREEKEFSVLSLCGEGVLEEAGRQYGARRMLMLNSSVGGGRQSIFP